MSALVAGVAPASATPAAGPAESRPALVRSSSPADDLARWQVTDQGAGHYAVTWTSPRRLPVADDRPVVTGVGGALDRAVVAPVVVGDDGRTLTTEVVSPRAPDPADLDVELSGDRLDETGDDLTTDLNADDPAPPGHGAAVRARELLDAPDPGAPGPYATVTSDYELDPVRLPGLREPIEMVGHVVEPAAAAPAGPRPLVLFLHGRHQSCYDPGDAGAYAEQWPCEAPFEEIPSHLGYDYVQRLLASQGYATVSVRVNGINAQDDALADGGADARAAIVERHLDHWADLAPAHRIDPREVVLVGHSRGGEGVDRAAIEIPLDAPYRVVGQVLLAPTDFAAHTAPYVPTVTVLRGCDGDVSDLQGQRFTDTGRDLAAADTSLKSSVMVTGANHNFFNTEWTPRTAAAPADDDWYGDPVEPCGRRSPERLDPGQQRAVGAAYVAAAVALFTDPDGAGAAYLPLVDGSAVTVASIGDADVRSAALGGGRDVRRPGLEATPSLPSGARTSLCQGVVSHARGDYDSCGHGLGQDTTVPHWRESGEAFPTRRFFSMAWQHPGAVGGLRFDDPLDLSVDRLELRTLVDPRAGALEVRVRLTDSTGASVDLTPDGGGAVAPFFAVPGATKLLAQSVLVDAAGATAQTATQTGGLDLADVVQVDLLGDSARGRLWLADVAAAPSRLAAVPEARLPQVNLHPLKVVEGDSPRERTARVPFDVVGELTRPARVSVLTGGRQPGSSHRSTIELAPGQHAGSIPVAFTADRVADLAAVTRLSAWPVREVVTDAYTAALRVVDDDPVPRTSVAVTRRVDEGHSAVVRVRLAAPVGYDQYVYARVVRTPGRRDLDGDDVSPRWRQRHSDLEGDPGRPLWRLGASVAAELSEGSRLLELRVPVAGDRRDEGREWLSLRVQLGSRTYVRRVVVRPSG